MLIVVGALLVGAGTAGAIIALDGGSGEGETLTQDAAAETVPTSDPEPVTTTDSSDPATSGTAGGSATTTSDPNPATPLDEASEVLIARWQAIDDGDYSQAYSYFSSTYELSETEWTNQQIPFSPDVNVNRIETKAGDTNPTNQSELWLEAEVPVTDGGESEAGNCRLFFGEVRMYREAGTWTLRPGVFAGREPSFANPATGDGGIEDIPESDPRCP